MALWKKASPALKVELFQHFTERSPEGSLSGFGSASSFKYYLTCGRGITLPGHIPK